MRTYFLLFFLSALITLFITPWIRTLGTRLRAYGHSDDSRERSRVPRMGGLAIYIATLACCAILLWVPNVYRNFILSERYTLALLLLPCTVVLLLGVLDDLSGTVPWQKLLIQVIAAGLVWWAGFRIEGFPVLGMKFHSQVLSFLLTEFWIVAVTNSFNLIDGLDGLAAGIALFVTVSVFVVSFLQASTPLVCILTIILAGSLLGFLRFNFVPATIFLGDTEAFPLVLCWRRLRCTHRKKARHYLPLLFPMWPLAFRCSICRWLWCGAS